jgi:hypothetical protein
MAKRQSHRVARPGKGDRKRDYAAEYARRISRAATKGLSRSQARGHPKPGEASVSIRKVPKPIADDRLQRALRTLRQEKSLSAAAKAARLSPERLRRLAQSKGAIRKKGRRWIIDPDLERRMRLYSRGREIRVAVFGEAASKIGAYLNAIRSFTETNDYNLLQPFVGQSITDTAGKAHPFETNPNTLYRLTTAGEGTFEQVYRLVL